MGKYKATSAKTIKTEKEGILSFFELGADVDFEIKRIYYTYNVSLESKRGGHAHKKLKQVLFCPYGEIEILLDDGFNRTAVLLDRPDQILIIEGLIWRDLVWKKENSVLCVGASDIYDESDYIRSYDEFLCIAKGGY